MFVRSSGIRRAIALSAAIVLGLVLVSCGSDDDDGDDGDATETTAAPSGDVRGFDGTTIKVASIGIKGQLPAVEWGAKARIDRFNKDNEIAGVKIEYVGFADDKQDPATALSEARRLVTDDEIFAIVGDVSANNPGQYFAQQKVPYFGYAFDNTYCSSEPSTELWGFGFSGCLVPDDPSELPDTYGMVYDYASQKLGKKDLTVASFSSDTQSGRNSTKFSSVTLEGAGFEVVFSKGILPPPPIADYTPYVQQLLQADGGKAPDVIVCLLAIDCIPTYRQIKANNFQGVFVHTLWSDALLQAMEGSIAQIQWANPADPSPAVDVMRADLKAVNPDQAVDIGVIAGYFSTSMFIDALKLVVEEDGKSAITPDAVREAASTMTFEIEGLIGPTEYPDATAVATGCRTLMLDDGTQWKTVVPFACRTKTFEL